MRSRNPSFYGYVFALILIKLLQVRGECGEPLKRICYYTSWGGVLPDPAKLCNLKTFFLQTLPEDPVFSTWYCLSLFKLLPLSFF